MSSGKRATGLALVILSVVLAAVFALGQMVALLQTAALFSEEGATAGNLGVLTGNVVAAILMGALVMWLFKKGRALRRATDPPTN